MDKQAPETMGIPEAAKLMGIGANTLYVLARNGGIPSRRIGNRVLVRRADVVDFGKSFPLKKAGNKASGTKA